MANKKKPEFSSSLTSFIQMLDYAKRDFEWNYTEVSRLDKLTQDYLHTLELDDANYSERAKIATRLAECRRLRRASKDTVEILTPLVEFIDSEKGKNMMNLLREALGKTRKAEERMKDRVYRYKILDRALNTK